MAERAEPGTDEHDELPPEGSVALTSLVLAQRLDRRANGERWTARDADGRALEVWRFDQADDAGRRPRADSAPGLMRVRHPNLVPVLAAGERDGAIWVASELDAGCQLRRLLTVATLTPEQAALIAAGVLGGLHALHRAGLWHGDLDSRTVRVGGAGQVRLGEWGLRVDGQDPDARCHGDRQAAVRLLGRLRTSVRWHARRPLDSATVMLRTLEACDRAGGEEVALLEQAGEAAAAVLQGRVGERATAELAALVAMLDRAPPSRAAPAPAAAAAPSTHRDALRSPAAVWAPAPHAGRRAAAGVALLLVIAMVGAVALAARHPRPPSAAAVPYSGRAASPPPVTGLRAPASPSPLPAGPRPVPALAPAAAGPITAIEIEPLEGSCQPNTTCPVQVTVRLQPQLAAEEVRWSFHVFDRCTGATDVLPGASVTALAGWAYVYGTSWPSLSATHPLALVAVTESPAEAASPAVLAGGSSAC